jgi:hypothetical protein
MHDENARKVAEAAAAAAAKLAEEAAALKVWKVRCTVRC